MVVNRPVYKELLSIIAITLLGATGLSYALLLATSSHAESATAGVTVGSACTMTAIIDTAHTAEVPASSSKEDIGSTELKTTCNDNGGFAVYAVGFSNDEYGNNKMLGANSEFNTGTATSGTNSNWSMKLSQITTGTYATTIDGGFGAYSNVPATFTKVAHRDASTDDPEASSATGSSIALTYGAYIASTQAPGDYTGKVKFTLVHPSTETPVQPQPSTAGCINYFANASDALGTMGCQSRDDNNSTLSDGATVTLLASNFSRTGYGFAGWSDAFDYATNPNAHFYGPQETITAPVGTTANGLSLYAVWIKSQGSIQDQSKVASVCSSLTTAPTDGTANLTSVSALTDQRDNNTYAIAKLADGNCWMIENLRLDNTATLTLTNTNNPLNDGANVTLKHNYSDTDTYNTLSPSQDPTTTAWCNSNEASCDDQSMLFTGNTTNRATNPTNNYTNNIYSYGNYYNWYSATAGRGTYSFRTNNDSVAGDLCPAGWRLPKGGQTTVNTTAEFYLLGKAIMDNQEPDQNVSGGYGYYGNSLTNTAGKTASAAIRSYPNNFVYSGYVNSGSVNGRGANGIYWSSTARDSSRAYSLPLGSSNVYPGTNGVYFKYNGNIVRCVSSGV